MHHRQRITAALVMLLGLAACGANGRQKEIDPQSYLTDALDLMEEQSINRDSLDWAQIRAGAMHAAAGAKDPDDTHQAIREALAALNDGHSFLLPAKLPWFVRILSASQEPEAPSARRVTDRVAYVRVPGFGGSKPQEFAQAVVGAIGSADGRAVCGWIVDVRGNTGGNMWPMLQGLAPLLGDEVPGYFASPDSVRTPWEVERTARPGAAPTPAHSPPAVAVLHDSTTASSGEAVVVAFRGRPHTRTFGQSTRGLSTANRTNILADGSKLMVTTSVFADRAGHLYGGRILPDQPIAPNVPESALLDLVATWIQAQLPCSGY